MILLALALWAASVALANADMHIAAAVCAVLCIVVSFAGWRNARPFSEE